LIRRFNYEKNSLWINQILGEHKVGDRSKLNWGVSYNIIDGSMPDRVQNIFRNEDTGYQLSSISAPDNHRYFQKLKEDELAANASYDYKFNKMKRVIIRGKSLWSKMKESSQEDFKRNSILKRTADRQILLLTLTT
jgi:hypothetical protein